MKIREMAGNALAAFASQGFSFLLSILTALLVPKVLGVQEFGYWQLFLFYSSYTGFFSLGISDGMYLIEGGKSRTEIDKRKVNSAFWFGIAYEIPLAAAIVMGCSLAGFEEQRQFVIVAAAIFEIVSFAWSTLGYVFQAMNETKLYSFAIIVNKFAFLVPLAVLLLVRCGDFRPFGVFYIFSNCCSLAYCIWKGRDILAAGLCSPGEAVRNGLGYIRVGIKLMLANVASMLILGFARFLIDAEWGIETFGELSFSLSMVNFFLAFVSQASMVLFPALRQSTGEERFKVYSLMRETLTILLPAVYLLCFPIIWIIGLWLPQYGDSLHYFVYLLPLCVFEGKMDLLGTTFFKVLREESTLLRVNIATAFLSLIGSLIGVYVIRSVDFVICSVVVSLGLRSLVSETLISQKMNDTKSLLSIGEIVVSLCFVIAGSLFSAVPATICYALVYVMYLLVFKESTRSAVSSICKIGRSLR